MSSRNPDAAALRCTNPECSADPGGGFLAHAWLVALVELNADGGYVKHREPVFPHDAVYRDIICAECAAPASARELPHTPGQRGPEPPARKVGPAGAPPR